MEKREKKGKKIMKIKNIITATVMGALVFGGVSVSAAFPDVPQWAYYSDAVEEVEKQGIFTGDHEGNFAPLRGVTRAEFAVIMCRFMEKDELEQPNEALFSDLPAGHWASPYVATAMKEGILRGFDDGTFRPNDYVTGEQAVKMVVCALGLEENANMAGGYPEGYIKIAKQKSLVEGEITNEEFLRKDAAVLIFNALNYIEKTDFSADGTIPENNVSASKPSGGTSSGGGSSKPSGGGASSSKPDKEEKPEEQKPQQPETEKPEEQQPETDKTPIWDELNLKQEEPDSCTASALTILLRRLYYTNGLDYSHITESELKADDTIWHPDLGLYYDINFEGIRVVKKNFDAETDKVEFFRKQLTKHPEGIIIYDTGALHAVVLTDYRDGVFYATDPATGLYTPLSYVYTMWGENQEEKLENIDAIWILEK